MIQVDSIILNASFGLYLETVNPGGTLPSFFHYINEFWEEDETIAPRYLNGSFANITIGWPTRVFELVRAKIPYTI